MVIAGSCFLLFAIALFAVAMIGAWKDSAGWKFSIVYATISAIAGLYLLDIIPQIF